ncbi:ABC transporter ATP-binding protein/permease [Paenibacillus sp. P96]|uniref:ABC transporter ATP-binding protein/permease n=1 Tax=Paenibacillus zeirhizosphaerae TaxID=2987519 RepID=A0ABT9FX17_9BACL|nr:ABC transporter ATP-binding protein [Paenibacillus sp. P96]MDP4099012.1 ABC transporter ATP-binding protein/permease [Paenibacillus sp. P96]
MNDKELLKDYVKKHWAAYTIAVLLIIASNIDQALLPLLLGHFTDRLQQGLLTMQDVIRYSLLVLAVAVTYNALFALGQYTVMKLGRRFEFFTRDKLFGKFSELGVQYYAKQGNGKLLSYVLNDVTYVREAISNGITQTTNAVFLLLSCIVMMLISGIPPLLICVSAGPLLLIPFLVVYFGPRIRERSRRVQESIAAMTEAAEEQLNGIRISKTFAVEEIARARYGATVDGITEKQLKLVRLSSLFQSLLPFLGSISLVISLLSGGFMVMNGSLTLGSFVALTLYLRIIGGPLQQIGNVINMMQRSGASLERVNRLMAEVPDVRDSEKPARLEAVHDIMLSGLTFTYPGSSLPALKNLNLSIREGQTLGIVGKTGSGKSTLIHLLLRIYDPPEGSMCINGRDIHTYSLDSLRSTIAYVPQDGFLFSTTIRDNIAFSDRAAPMLLIEDGARQAMIYDNIIRFPDRFDTRLGERGVTLSGGQRQRTSLARGLIKNSSLLILDDSMSAVDAVTEKGILASLRSMRKGKTTLIVSHRISAVMHADQIIVLEEGQLAESGTHPELLARQGIYAAMHKLQEEGLQDAADQ